MAVGVIGYIEPRTLGVGYDNIQRIISGELLGISLVALVVLKFVSWSIYLGSGTSGGTLAPLFTIGGGLGAALGAVTVAHLPALGVDVRVAALVGMAAIFAGASRALLASVVFAFETTRQPMGLLPLLAGCSAAHLISLLLMRHSIMTEKLARRGTLVRTEYAVDYLSQLPVREAMTSPAVTLAADDALERVRVWLDAGAGGAAHQGFPVLDARGELVGVVTRRDLLDPRQPGARPVREAVKRAPVAVFEDNTLRDAADHMVRERVGRLPVLSRRDPCRVVGVVSRSDLLAAHHERLEAAHSLELHLRLARRRTTDA